MSLLDALLLDPAPFNVWIAHRTDGIKGSGTASDPYDGSTQTKFDGVMKLFAAQSNINIRLGPGEFLTNGYADGVDGGWQARPGMKIIGSGIDVTKLTLINVAPGSAKHFFAIGHSLATVAVAFEVSDLTIDCNISAANNNAACGGVRVMGNHARIERVKVKNWGTKSAGVPCFALSVITAYPDTGPADVVNAGIEGCVVIEPYDNNAALATALNAGSQNDLGFTKEGHAKSPFIRNCFVDCATPGQAFTPSFSSPKYCGISMSWCRGGVAEGNHVYNVDIAGPYQDQRSVRDLIVRNNFYKNVARGPHLNLGQLGVTLLGSDASLSVTGGVATVFGGGLNVTSLAVGDRVSLTTTSPTTFTGVHQITSVQSSPSVQFTFQTTLVGSATVTSIKKALSVSRAIIEGNIIELAQVSGAIAVAVADLIEQAVIDVEDLAASIEKLHGNPALVKQHAQAGLAFARTLTWDSLIPKWLQLIHSFGTSK